MTRYRASKYQLPLFLAFIVVLLAACSSAAPAIPQAATAEPTEAAELPTSEPVLDTGGDAPGGQNPQATIPAVEPTPDVSSTEPADHPDNIKPTPRPDLHATDPSTVSLASGQVQLVEFFAFW